MRGEKRGNEEKRKKRGDGREDRRGGGSERTLKRATVEWRR